MTREQFIRYVEQEQEQLRRFLLALCCGNREEADDIAQDTLVKAYLSSERYRDEGKFTAWLYKIAHNTFLDRKKAHRYHEELEEAKKNMDKYADYRTYLSFDMQQIVQGEEDMKIGLGKMIRKNSGGEGQNPKYVALLAGFAMLYMQQTNRDSKITTGTFG